jgi:hypothetical protein
MQGSKSSKRGKYSYGAPTCQQQVEKQQETVIMLDPTEDEATITSLEGSCADYHPGWDTLGGGCDVLCDHTSDLLRINLFASKSMAFGSSGSGAPVQCRWGLGGLCIAELSWSLRSDLQQLQQAGVADCLQC